MAPLCTIKAVSAHRGWFILAFFLWKTWVVGVKSDRAMVSLCVMRTFSCPISILYTWRGVFQPAQEATQDAGWIDCKQTFSFYCVSTVNFLMSPTVTQATSFTHSLQQWIQRTFKLRNVGLVGPRRVHTFPTSCCCVWIFLDFQDLVLNLAPLVEEREKETCQQSSPDEQQFEPGAKIWLATPAAVPTTPQLPTCLNASDSVSLMLCWLSQGHMKLQYLFNAPEVAS